MDSRRKTALKSLKRKDTVGMLLLGDVDIGKSALIRRWVNNDFPENYQATVEDFFMKTIICMNQRVNVTIIDIAGSRQFPTMDDLYIARSDVLMLVYEIGNQKSIDSMKWYYDSARKTLNDKKVAFIVVGTKYDKHGSDIHQNIETGLEFFTELPEQPAQFSTSAKNGHNVKELFEHGVKEILKNNNVSDKRAKFERQITIEAMEDEKEKKPCCTIL
eukprot:TCONS_00065930-protein